MHRNLECQVHESRQIGSGQTRDGKSERQHSRNQKLKWTGMGEFNSDDHCYYYYYFFFQMTIISTTVGRNPPEEMEWPSWSTKESEMQYLDAISKTTE